MMSNAKLKEQIEAAKIALVHSAEAGAYADTPPTSGTVTQIPAIGANHAQLHDDSPAHIDSVSEVPHSPISAETQLAGQDTIPQSDFETLEARLQSLEDQIKNQQRDLHTLLQKLRDITAKSQAVAEPKKRKSTKKWMVGAALCVIGFGAVYYWLGTAVITGIFYQVTGFMVALIDMLAGKI
ncbi:MAG: hypothetical protein ACO3SW_06385 [Candidatus Puniceispirillaceae bacterium]